MTNYFCWTILFGAVLTAIAPAKAEEQLWYPEQFYTDGRKIDGWQEQRDGRNTTIWFARYADDELAYRQVIIHVFGGNFEEAYYQDAAAASICALASIHCSQLKRDGRN